MDLSNGRTKNDTRTDRWAAFCDLVRHMSFDRLICFFDGFVRDKRKAEDERLQRLYTNLGLHRRRKLGHDDSSVNGDRAVAEGVPHVRTPTASFPLAPPDGTETVTMQNNPVQDREDAKNQPHPSPPPSASSSPPRRQTAMQKKTTRDGQPQATATPCGTGKRSRSGLDVQQDEEETDTESGSVPAFKRQRMSPLDGDHSADNASTHTPTHLQTDCGGRPAQAHCTSSSEENPPPRAHSASPVVVCGEAGPERRQRRRSVGHLWLLNRQQLPSEGMY
ncbi:hypothetical protein VTK56DRAFT_5806 [Thermocarpiscus australiensis]